MIHHFKFIIHLSERAQFDGVLHFYVRHCITSKYSNLEADNLRLRSVMVLVLNFRFEKIILHNLQRSREKYNRHYAAELKK